MLCAFMKKSIPKIFVFLLVEEFPRTRKEFESTIYMSFLFFFTEGFGFSILSEVLCKET